MKHQYKKLPVTMKMWMQFNVIPWTSLGVDAGIQQVRLLQVVFSKDTLQFVCSVQWRSSNFLSLHSSKTEFHIIGLSQELLKLINVSLTCAGIDKNLTTTQHISCYF